jgi:hypothetical protein
MILEGFHGRLVTAPRRSGRRFLRRLASAGRKSPTPTEAARLARGAVTLRRDDGGPFLVAGDPSSLSRALANVIGNAFPRMPSNGTSGAPAFDTSRETRPKVRVNGRLAKI